MKVEFTPFELLLPKDSKISTNSFGDIKINGGDDFGMTISKQTGSVSDKMKGLIAYNESITGSGEYNESVNYLVKKKDGFISIICNRKD